MSTPRPSVTVDGPSSGAKKRQILWDARLKRILAIPPEEEAAIRKILAAYRRRQTRKLGARDEDPNPYDSKYIFYCLDGKRET